MLVVRSGSFLLLVTCNPVLPVTCCHMLPDGSRHPGRAIRLGVGRSLNKTNIKQDKVALGQLDSVQ